ncbi:hypothetical protein Y032_0350g3211 [Ancylostoma ceylanicum]|uniref:Uncharacterized protein n=1 Tax=Ancylostoma ceylanicum TaxID=53326 RepID=A0A016RWN6_9BILA|nr:hypothetical protein Y032_0350g3211 [Ancylostoma ceylanicum]
MNYILYLLPTCLDICKEKSPVWLELRKNITITAPLNDTVVCMYPSAPSVQRYLGDSSDRVARSPRKKGEVARNAGAARRRWSSSRKLLCCDRRKPRNVAIANSTHLSTEQTQRNIAKKYCRGLENREMDG